MFNNLRIKVRVWWKSLFSKKQKKPGFVNPYAMTSTTTPTYYSPPKFKGGKFVLDKENPDRNPWERKEEVEKAPEPKKRNGSIVSSLKEVIIEDLEGLSGEAKKRAKREAFDKEKYENFLELTGFKK